MEQTNSSKSKHHLRKPRKRQPKNITDKRYLRSEQHIHAILHRALHSRSITVRVRELCRQAHITDTTFYFHRNSNSTAALHKYERELIQEFKKLLPRKTQNAEVIFTVLLKFILKHHAYFNATLPNDNNFVLRRILTGLRSNFSSNPISDKNFYIYVGNLISIISCWATCDHFHPKKLERYTTRLVQTRFIDYGL